NDYVLGPACNSSHQYSKISVLRQFPLNRQLFTKQVKKFIVSIRNDWRTWEDEAEQEILYAYGENNMIFMMLFAGHVLAILVVFVGVPFSPIILDFLVPLNESRPKQFVYPVTFWFDTEKYFHFTLIHGCITGTIIVIFLESSEAMYAVFTHHACALFAIISYRFKNALNFIENKKFRDEKEAEIELYEIMSLTVKLHSSYIDFANALEDFFSPIMFISVGFYTLSASSIGFQALISLGQLDKTIRFSFSAIGIMFHLFILTLPGQKLLDCSYDVVQNAYDSSWYQMPIRVKKLLLMITMRGHVPCKVTAGKIYVVNMITFSALLRTAVSYLTMFISIRS
ncbi:odorant receptor 13a-like, partial [Leptopilina heterotoma]|uniref:odorant receptor 13a-like n=1 Tax=Leptopilina heterotoma TaxID=63436 RepID=UPI001CA8AB23